MSDVVQMPLFTAETARALTDEVKADAQALWRKLLRLYEGAAHTALGYSSWAEYCRAEFDMGRARAYQMLEAAQAVDTLEAAVQHVGLPTNDRQARELTPLRDEPERMGVAWEAATERALDEDRPVTAADVREAVQVVRAQSSEPVEETRHRLAVHFSSATDEWATPQAFYDVVREEFNPTLDVCCLPSSAKCERYFTPEDNGLEQTWTGVCWMNPPYGEEIKHWVKKAHDSALEGATVVCLVPARVDTGWWHDYCRHAEVRFIRGRLRFGEATASAPFPSALVIFGRDPVTTFEACWTWQP